MYLYWVATAFLQAHPTSYFTTNPSISQANGHLELIFNESRDVNVIQTLQKTETKCTYTSLLLRMKTALNHEAINDLQLHERKRSTKQTVCFSTHQTKLAAWRGKTLEPTIELTEFYEMVVMNTWWMNHGHPGEIKWKYYLFIF